MGAVLKPFLVWLQTDGTALDAAPLTWETHPFYPTGRLNNRNPIYFTQTDASSPEEESWLESPIESNKSAGSSHPVKSGEGFPEPDSTGPSKRNVLWVNPLDRTLIYIYIYIQIFRQVLYIPLNRCSLQENPPHSQFTRRCFSRTGHLMCEDPTREPPTEVPPSAWVLRFQTGWDVPEKTT